MRGIKCADCAEYKNEWCEKIIDSPHPDLTRDCQYWHEKKDMVEVVRCKDCKWFGLVGCAVMIADDDDKPTENDYCSFGERGEQE